jgi:diguanylate cyclase (GGDEF)-like protein/PAS domain S-box-containing protein
VKARHERYTVERLRALFENNLDAVLYCDQAGRLIDANEAAKFMLSFGAEPSQKLLESIVAPSERGTVALHFTRTLGGAATEFETKFVRTHGTLVPVIVTFQPVVVGEDVVGVYVLAKDATAIRDAEAAVARSEQQFRSIFEYHYDAAVALNLDGRFMRVNAAMERLTGYRVEELVAKKGPPQIVAARDVERERAAMARVFSGETLEYDLMVVRKDGSRCETRVHAMPMTADGRVSGAFMFLKDVSAQRALERLVAANDERMRSLYLVASSPATDIETQIGESLTLGAQALGMEFGFVASVENYTMKILNRHGDEHGFAIGSTIKMSNSLGRRFYGTPRALAVNDLSVEPYASDMARHGRPWKSFIGTTILVDGAPYGIVAFCGVEARAVPFAQADLDFLDLMSSFVGTAIERERRQHELEEMAFHDGLTGLANRALLEEHTVASIARARRTGERLAIHYIDLDGFKPINDTHGHAAGDEVLREVARRYSSVVREHDVVARVGGDEFVILQGAITDDTAIRALARRLLRALHDPIVLQSGASVHVGGSHGMAVFPKDAADAEALLQMADADMYRAKDAAHRGVRTLL